MLTEREIMFHSHYNFFGPGFTRSPSYCHTYVYGDGVAKVCCMVQADYAAASAIVGGVSVEKNEFPLEGDRHIQFCNPHFG